MTTTSTEAIAEHWRRIRQEAIEIALKAERQLIAMGELDECDRRVITRQESRAANRYGLSCQAA